MVFISGLSMNFSDGYVLVSLVILFCFELFIFRFVSDMIVGMLKLIFMFISIIVRVMFRWLLNSYSILVFRLMVGIVKVSNIRVGVCSYCIIIICLVSEVIVVVIMVVFRVLVVWLGDILRVF